MRFLFAREEGVDLLVAAPGHERAVAEIRRPLRRKPEARVLHRQVRERRAFPDPALEHLGAPLRGAHLPASPRRAILEGLHRLAESLVAPRPVAARLVV